VFASIHDFERQAVERWGLLDDEERPLVPPSERFASAADVVARLQEAHAVSDLAVEGRSVDLGGRTVEGIGVRGTELAPIITKLNELVEDGTRVGIVVGTKAKADRLIQMLAPHDCYPVPLTDPSALEPQQLGLFVGDLPRGFVAASSGWAFVPSTALFGAPRRAAQAERSKAFFDAGVTSIAQLKEGDPVVHRLHGVGLYRGLMRVDVHGEQDFVRVEYKGGDLLYLPATSLNQLSRYMPAKGEKGVKLDRLGGQTWQNRKGRVRDSLLKMAQELLRTQARREVAQREPHPPRGSAYAMFEASFPFEETPDQAKAIDAVHDDLSHDEPMDRLVVGDVGFGKTEVAMRAAMRVVEGGRQVAVLCPTTVLAYQHWQTFRDRFASFPITVEMMSRFRTAAEMADITKRIKEGKVDVVVGTTAVLARGVRFPNLGLMVVDEEHRFGVKQKERLKKLRATVDILAMSATPIPRTLQMGLSGMREMSIMATPPNDRLEVRTSMARFGRARVRDAILFELDRGGQVFFVHNRVQTIEAIAGKLAEWVPEARVRVAHGKMDSAKLEDTLVSFIRKDFDLLVCTAIMESGIDLPNVNTMVINRADLFGLAQLYQLRGRVGRGAVRASCLLLVPEELPREARRRVQVLVDHTRLGSGFNVAMADLEMRGAGNLLGSAQSGNIDAVGYEVWLELLEQAVGAARGDIERDRIEPEVEVPVPAFLPDKMVPDTRERLAWYQRLSNAVGVADVDRLLDDLEDEVGELSPEVRNLGGLVQSRVYCRSLGISRCSWLKVRVVLELHPQTVLTEKRLAAVVARYPKRFKVTDNIVDVRFTPSEAEHPFRFLRWVFTQLRKKDGPSPAGGKRRR
jgi:transcription-repair coupling factor (superfamily II helicase)